MIGKYIMQVAVDVLEIVASHVLEDVKRGALEAVEEVVVAQEADFFSCKIYIFNERLPIIIGRQLVFSKNFIHCILYLLIKGVLFS